MLYNIFFLLVGVFTGFSGYTYFVPSAEIAYGAPVARLERTLIPETDVLYDLGTTTKRWRYLYTQTASTSALTISGVASCSGSNALTTNTSGVVACGAITSGSTFPFTATSYGVSTSTTIGLLQGFLSNASSTISASTTITGVLTASGGVYGNLTGLASLATALNANGSNCTAGNYPLGVDASGNVEDCTAATAGGSSYPFALTGNATSTLTQFNGGLTAYASSTIGSGAQAGGLTISGGATTTGDHFISGALTLGTDLAVAQGGTGASTLTGLLQGNGTSAFTAITDSSTIGQILRVTGASTYAWGALDLTDGDAYTGALPQANGGTGSSNAFGTGVLTWIQVPTAANLQAAVSGTTGTAGSLVFSGSPTLTTPNLGTPSALTLTNATGLLPAGINLTKGNFLVGNDAGIAQATSTIFISSTGNVGIGTASPNTLLEVNGTASTSALVVSTKTGVLIGNGTSAVTAGSAQTCTNQFVRAMSASYVATCATVGAADVSLANLSATDSTLTFSGTYTGATARTIGINLAQPNTWTGLQQFSNASSTQFSAATQTFYIDSAGKVMAKDTTNNWSGRLSPTRYLPLQQGTTTAWTGTTTGAYTGMIVLPFSGTARELRCYMYSTTANWHLSGAFDQWVIGASSTVGTIQFSKTFSANSILYYQAGNPSASTATSTSCTLGVTET